MKINLKKHLKNYFTLLFLFVFIGNAFCQQRSIIILKKADFWKNDKTLGEDIERIIGNAEFELDSATLFCDSAYLNKKENNIDAFGHVHIKSGDTLDIYSDLLNYDGNTRIAELHNNVTLIDNQTTLTTNDLIYHRKTKVANYYSGGKIVNKDNQLTSLIGYYFTRQKEFFFKDSVVLTNPDYVMTSDSLLYNTLTEIAYFQGPTNITGDNKYVYCEDGWYNTKSDVTLLKKKVFIINKEQTIKADTVFYDKLSGFGEAFNNIVIIDTVQNTVAKGNYLRYNKTKEFAYLTDSAEAILIDKRDSLFLHADSLIITFDSTQSTKKMFAYYKAKFYRKNLQGLCDSLVYDFVDSTINLYNDPAIWSEENQLTADSIKIAITNKTADSLTLYNSAFIISQNDSLGFNQIKGKNMIGYFKDNELRKIFVSGNAETIYYIIDDGENKERELIGINKSVSSYMIIFLVDNKVKDILYLEKPDETLFPENELPAEEKLLKGFEWLDEFRPKNKSEIFNWKKK